MTGKQSNPSKFERNHFLVTSAKYLVADQYVFDLIISRTGYSWKGRRCEARGEEQVDFRTPINTNVCAKKESFI